MVSTDTQSIARPNQVKQGVSWGVDGAVLATPAVIGSESSPTPQGTSSFVDCTFQGAGSRSLPGAAVGGGGGTAPYSLDTCDQVHKNRGLSPEEIAKRREEHKQALVEALRASGREGEALAVLHCGEDFKVGKCLDCGACPAFPITCDHRLCPDCAARRASLLVSEHQDMLKQLRYPKMLTLTFLSVEHLDKAYVRWARNCFTRLRRRKVMAGCWGGIYSFEVTHSYKYGWHLHIHSLIGSGYIDQGDLSREWQEIAGACVVDIRAVQGKDKWGAVKEVVKYPAKAATFLDKPALVNEFLLATVRVNLAYGFGVLYRVRTRRHSEAKMRCPVCGGSDVSFRDGFGFCVPRLVVERVKGGYIWRSPPS
ncbi:hypothetical protein ES703_86855 [subsurface metagenome]